jgi:hypothetical protein
MIHDKYLLKIIVTIKFSFKKIKHKMIEKKKIDVKKTTLKKIMKTLDRR